MFPCIHVKLRPIDTAKLSEKNSDMDFSFSINQQPITRFAKIRYQALHWILFYWKIWKQKGSIHGSFTGFSLKQNFFKTEAKKFLAEIFWNFSLMILHYYVLPSIKRYDYSNMYIKSATPFWHMFAFFVLASALETHFAKCVSQMIAQILGFQKITLLFMSDLSFQRILHFWIHPVFHRIHGSIWLIPVIKHRNQK